MNRNLCLSLSIHICTHYCVAIESMIINKTIAMRFGIVNTKRLINAVLENNCKSEIFRSRSEIFRQEVILE